MKVLATLVWSGVLLVATVLVLERDASAQDKQVKIRDIALAVPAKWKQQPPSNRLRLAQFVIPAVEGDKEAAELVISSFGGDGGGVKANVTRWQKQFQAEGRKSALAKGQCEQGEYVVVELSGTYNKPDGPPILRKTKPMPNARMVGVILKVEGKGFYFLKLTGPDKTVAAAGTALRKSMGAEKSKETPLE